MMFMSNRKEQFNVAYVHAMATQAGLNTGNMRVDNQSIDLDVDGVVPTATKNRFPKISLQLKATSQQVVKNGVIKFPLPRKNYDDLKNDRLIVPRYLIVLLMPEDPMDWIEHHSQHMTTCAAGSRYVLPSRYAADRCMSKATLNRVTQIVAERAKTAGLPLQPFTVHDLRRTGSTLLNEAGFNGDWIEKSLAHGGDGRSLRAVYNKAEYGVQRRHMLQEWANMIDAWVQGGGYSPELLPPDMAMSPGRSLPARCEA